MSQELYDGVLSHLTTALSEISKAHNLLQNEKIKFVIIDTLLSKVDEAIFRWKSRH